MSHRSIILVGAGGHGKSVVEVIENASQNFRIQGYLDVFPKNDFFWSRYKFLGEDNDHLIKKRSGYHISLGMINDLFSRENLFKSFKQKGAFFPIIRSRYSVVSKYTEIEEGSILMHNVILNVGVKIGINCIINSKCLIEHDTIIGNHCHISTGAIVNADCIIGNNVFLGSNSTVNRGIEIGHNVIVGSGSVVTRNIPSNTKVMGVPAKEKEKL